MIANQHNNKRSLKSIYEKMKNDKFKTILNPKMNADDEEMDMNEQLLK